MVLDWISQLSDALIYLSVIGKNIICTIRQALMPFSKTGMYGEQATSWILLRKLWYQIYESRIL